MAYLGLGRPRTDSVSEPGPGKSEMLLQLAPASQVFNIKQHKGEGAPLAGGLVLPQGSQGSRSIHTTKISKNLLRDKQSPFDLPTLRILV